MFSKFFQKATQPAQYSVRQGMLSLEDVKPRVSVHYGIPSTASVLAFDPFQYLLAIGTLDGRIKVIGGDNIEGLLISPKPLPFKNLEFFENQGFLVSISNENEIQVWDLENRNIASNLQWESNITALSVIYGTHYMYIGDEYGFLSVLKYDVDEGKILQLPYYLPANVISETVGSSLSSYPSIVGALPQPCSSGNRVLIAYENGLMILWDVTEDQAVLIRDCKDIQLKDGMIVGSHDVRHKHSTDSSDNQQAEKEISSICWASLDGSILAVGYVDGDILLWNLLTTASTEDLWAKKSSNNIVKVQLSSGDRRLPVIVLHWSANRTHGGHGSQLFVYGGDEIGSEEVLTILSLDWSSGIETLQCTARVDLTLSGSFADMILISSTCAAESKDGISLFILTNPGQLHFYDETCLSTLKSDPQKQHSVCAIQYPMIIPTIEPCMTVAKLSLLHTEGKCLRAVSETALNLTSVNTKWPLTGGVPSQLSFNENNGSERIYIAGYQDGTVRAWDATLPVMSLLFVLRAEVEGVELSIANAAVSALDFSSNNLSLAIGNEAGLVLLYKLLGSPEELSWHFVTETKHEVRSVPCGNGFQCTAVFSLLNSPVRAIQYISCGVRLAVGFECGQVAMLDISTLSVLFLTDSLSGSSASVISVKTFPVICSNSQKYSEDEILGEHAKEAAFILTNDAHVAAIDGTSGNMISNHSLSPNKLSSAISLYILEGKISAAEDSEKGSHTSAPDFEAKSKPMHENSQHQSGQTEVEHVTPQTEYLGQRFMDSIVLVCCEDALRLYSMKSVIKGENESIYSVNLVKPCCWTTIFKKDDNDCGLIMVYQNGVIEIRSLPDLDVVLETSLMSIVRWNLKTNLNKTLSSSEKGQIVLVNGCEIAFISFLAFENDFRIPEALPCLHDKVLAAAADTAVSFCHTQKKQNAAPGIFGGIIKGLKGGVVQKGVDLSEVRETFVAHLESIFSRFLFSDPSTNVADELEALELNIDDIEIDEPGPVSSSSLNGNFDKIDKETERERLFEGGSTDTKPRLRTREEIIAKYRKPGDATSAAAHARDKLVERQEKLARLSRNTEELQSGAENFASMANELAKAMEKRKWWNI